MNYLAHVYLARDTGAARLGQLLGDFRRGLDVDRLPHEVRAGLAEHAEVDRFTDAHARVRRSRARFEPPLRRFAGIVVDVAFDHFLVRHWDRFSTQPLASVTSGLYRALEEHRAILPPRLAAIAPAMVRDDWLGSYGDLANVDRALRGIGARFRRETPLAAAGAEVRRRYAGLEADFLTFFPRLVAFVEARKARGARESRADGCGEDATPTP